jgi:hypothetical protein
MEAATRWALRVSACAFRQTLNFLKSDMPKDELATVFRYAVPIRVASFHPKRPVNLSRGFSG